MNLYQLMGIVDDIGYFKSLNRFMDFAKYFLEFLSHSGMQADIISKNESYYHFYQYKEDGHFCITRPINQNIFLNFDEFDSSSNSFLYSLEHIREISEEQELRMTINKCIYTYQQCIGAILDAFNNPNKARKRNGLLFEVLIRETISSVGINITSGEESIPLGPTGEKMKFQHDAIIKNANEEIKAIGQLKTSSKDRLDKIFLDKFMYQKLTNTDIPHFAIFLNDVQRKEVKQRNNSLQYGINSTFLPGHFNAYRVALNPLDGVYYFDLRPSMITDSTLSPYIKSFDNLIVCDIWDFLE